jgi:hypothetical protein
MPIVPTPIDCGNLWNPDTAERLINIPFVRKLRLHRCRMADPVTCQRWVVGKRLTRVGQSAEGLFQLKAGLVDCVERCLQTRQRQVYVTLVEVIRLR